MADILADEKYQMQLLSEKYIEKLISMWKEIFDDKMCKHYLQKFFNYTQECFEDVVQATKAYYSQIENDYTQKKNEAEKLKRVLHVDVELPLYNKGEVPLSIVQLKMEQILQSLQDQLTEKRKGFTDMVNEEKMLCEELGEPQRPQSEDSLPTTEEIEEFRKYLNNLHDIKEQRLNRITNMREGIKNFLYILKQKVKTVTEDRLLNYNKIKLGKDTLAGLQHMYNRYGKEVEELTENINSMKKKLENLWEDLNVSPKTTKKFQCYVENNQETYGIFQAELKRCETLKRRNVKDKVLKIREEIREWWEKTLKSESERRNFLNFYNDCYTEDLVELHELELIELKSYYETNRKIFELYENRNVLWDRMVALNAKLSESSRCHNHGGQLIKEQNERKTVAVKLPKVEQEIHDLVKQYEALEKKPFLVYGVNIIIAMALQWKEQRLQKEEKSSARKNIPVSVKTYPSMQSFKTSGAATTWSKRKIPTFKKDPPLLKHNLTNEFNVATASSKTSGTNKNIKTSSLTSGTQKTIAKNSTTVSARRTTFVIQPLKTSGAATTGQKREMPNLEEGPPLPKRNVTNEFNVATASSKTSGTNKNIKTSSLTSGTQKTIAKNSTTVSARRTTFVIQPLKTSGAATTGQKREMPNLEEGPPLPKRNVTNEFNVATASSKTSGTNKNIKTSSLTSGTQKTIAKNSTTVSARRTTSVIQRLKTSGAATTGQKREMPNLEEGPPLPKRNLTNVFHVATESSKSNGTNQNVETPVRSDSISEYYSFTSTSSRNSFYHTVADWQEL